MHKSKDIFTSQLLKVACYKTVVKKGMLQMYIYTVHVYLKYKFNRYQAYKTLM